MMLNVRITSTLDILIKHFDQCINILLCGIDNQKDKEAIRSSIELAPFYNVIKELEDDGTATGMIYDFSDEIREKYEKEITLFKTHLTLYHNYWDKLYTLEADDDSLLISLA